MSQKEKHMSHFTVMVVGDDPEYQLAPFHKFECTGQDDEFVQNIDRLDEARVEFENDTTNCLRRLSDGTLHSFFDDEGEWKPEFSEPDPEEKWDKNRRRKYTPEGYERVDVKTSELQTLAKFIEDYYGANIIDGDAEPDLTKTHKYGWCRVKDGEVVEYIDRTNPNKKWDGWKVGGRWSGMLILKDGDTADQARKFEIDFEAMRSRDGDEAAQEWDTMKAARDAAGAGDTWQSFDAMRDAAKDRGEKIDAVREAYWAQPAIAAMRQTEAFRCGGFDLFLASRENFIAAARNRATATFAFLMDRKWAEKGEMGWFGMSNDHMTQDEWNAWINAKIEALPDHALITIVDCHI